MGRTQKSITVTFHRDVLLGYSQKSFIKDIDGLEEEKWIDGLTSLVYLTCRFINRNVNMNVTTRYAFEFTASGITRPEAPFITVSENVDTSGEHKNSISVLYIFGLFTFAMEFFNSSYDSSLEWTEIGRKYKYLPAYPSMKPIDVVDMIMLVLSCFIWCITKMRDWYKPIDEFGYCENAPGAERGCLHFHSFVFSDASLTATIQQFYGLLFLMLAMRCICMCDSVPRLNVIGRTLALSVGPISMFLVVFFMMMLGFTVLFFMFYTSQVPEFQTLSLSFFTIFRGMLGDIPLDSMWFVHPMITQVVFMAFSLIMVFTVFTILIAIISSSYDVVLADVEGQTLDEDDRGAVAFLLRCVLSKLGLYTTTVLTHENRVSMRESIQRERESMSESDVALYETDENGDIKAIPHADRSNVVNIELVSVETQNPVRTAVLSRV